MQEIAVLASRVLTAQREYTATADNVANVNTQGFRKLTMDFQEVLSRPGGHAAASYTADRSIGVSQAQGTLEKTGNPLDLAISGAGYFAIQVNGEVQYTRRGNFLVGADGVVVTPEGNPLLDNALTPIQVPQDARGLTVAADGSLSTDQGQLAQIGVYGFTAEQTRRLQRVGNTAFVPAGNFGGEALPAPQVRQGYLESSNVNAVEEMVTMQRVSKAYEGSVNLLRGVEDLEQRAIRNLAQ